jgi:hypothetical protein
MVTSKKKDEVSEARWATKSSESNAATSIEMDRSIDADFMLWQCRYPLVFRGAGILFGPIEIRARLLAPPSTDRPTQVVYEKAIPNS